MFHMNFTCSLLHLNMGPLEEQSVLIISELSLHPCCYYYFCVNAPKSNSKVRWGFALAWSDLVYWYLGRPHKHKQKNDPTAQCYMASFISWGFCDIVPQTLNNRNLLLSIISAMEAWNPHPRVFGIRLSLTVPASSPALPRFWHWPQILGSVWLVAASFQLLPEYTACLGLFL